MFEDRKQAGRELAKKLLRFKDQSPVVLALPRGGVTIGFEIARRLNAPLDVVLVRKIGAPVQPELAVAAVADGEHPEMAVNRDVVELLSIPESYLAEERKRQLEEIERRRALYVGDRPRPPVAGHTAIVVDDGIATGATVRAALAAVRRAGPSHLVLAVPVAPAETIAELRPDVDEIECLETPPDFMAIGSYYEDFLQVTDDEVIAMLAEAARFAPAQAAGAKPGAKRGGGKGGAGSG
jgi:putative phosphoribosyl transferase